MCAVIPRMLLCSVKSKRHENVKRVNVAAQHTAYRGLGGVVLHELNGTWVKAGPKAVIGVEA